MVSDKRHVLFIGLVLTALQPLGAGKFVFDAGYVQPGEYIVSADTGESNLDDEEIRPIAKWIGQTLEAQS